MAPAPAVGAIGPYRIRSGGSERLVEVREADVQSGRRIRVRDQNVIARPVR